MQKGPQETIKLPPGAQNFLAHLAFFLMWDHCALQGCHKPKNNVLKMPLKLHEMTLKHAPVDKIKS